VGAIEIWEPPLTARSRARTVRVHARTVRAETARLRRDAAKHHRVRIPAGAPAAGRLVGVVDDDAAVCRALTRLLRAAGFAVKAFGSGEEFLAWEGLGAVDCLVVDVQLGSLSGFDVQKRLKAISRSLPVVFITAVDDEVMRMRAHQVFDSQVLYKPFDARTLIEAIEAAGARTKVP
jgi:FixJ family two-component response regulator